MNINAEQPPHRYGFIGASAGRLDGKVWIEFVHTRDGDSFGTDHIVVDPAGALALARELIAATEEARRAEMSES